MADFQFKFAWWDKARPKTLKSTGLGKALTNYETLRATFMKNPLPHRYTLARKALGEVEKCRAAAIKECGTNPLFAGIKKNLQGGVKQQVEVAVLSNALDNKLTAVMKKVSGELDKQIASLQNRIDFANGLLAKLQNNTAKLDDRNKIERLVESEGDGKVPGTSDLGDEYMALKNNPAYYQGICPNAVAIQKTIDDTKYPELVRIVADYADVFDTLKTAYNKKPNAT